MNLENRTVSIQFASTTVDPAKTVVKVAVSEDIMEGVKRVVGTYEIEINELHFDHSSPALMSAINEKLALIPE